MVSVAGWLVPPEKQEVAVSITSMPDSMALV